MTQFNAKELAVSVARILKRKGFSAEAKIALATKFANEELNQAYTAGYNKAVQDAVEYMKSYAKNMEEPMCEYTHTQNEAQKYILNRVSKEISKLKKG